MPHEYEITAAVLKEAADLLNALGHQQAATIIRAESEACDDDAYVIGTTSLNAGTKTEMHE